MNRSWSRRFASAFLRAQPSGAAFAALLATLGLLASHPAPVAAAQPADWPMFGQNAANTAANPSETTISRSNANQLKVTWTFTSMGDVSARAAVVDGVVYFPDWGGYLTALNASPGQLIWSRSLSSYDGLGQNTHSRTTPAVVN